MMGRHRADSVTDASSRLVDVEEVKRDVAGSNYTFSNFAGRRYASADLGNYYMPNDAPEVQRLNEQHMVLTAAKNGHLHNAPVPTHQPGLKILDVGCGSGIWCLQMAEEYPEAMIVGMDISPIQRKEKPANVEWIVHDMEKEWPFADEYFDFVHLSLVHGCVTDWEEMMAKTVRHVAPGGYVEHQEFSLCRQYTLDLDTDQPIRYADNVDINTLPPFFRWGRLMEQAAQRRGRVLQLGPKLMSFQTGAGLQHVTEDIYPIPTGTWHTDPRQRQLGARMMLQALQGMEGFTTVMFTKALGWSLEDTLGFVDKIKLDLRDDNLHKVIDLHVVWGRKPGEGKGLGRYAGRPAEAWKGLLGSQSVQFAGGMLMGAAIVGVLVMTLTKKR